MLEVLEYGTFPSAMGLIQCIIANTDLTSVFARFSSD
jgi:hypothetical protein